MIDHEICVRCGICEETCPEIFKMDEDENKVTVVFETVPPESEESARQAAEDCAVEAITIEA